MTPVHDSDMDWKAIATGQAESPTSVRARTPVMTVKFIHREQVVQVIEGDSGRKGEISVITNDYDLDAHDVERVVTRLAYARADQRRDNEHKSRVDTPGSGVWEGTS